MIRILTSIFLTWGLCPATLAVSMERTPSTLTSYLTDQTREKLSQAILEERITPWVHVKSANGPSGWVPAHEVWSPVSFSRIGALTKKSRTFETPGGKAIPNPVESEQQQVHLLGSSPPWFQVQIPKGPIFWVHQEDLQTVDSDLGFGYITRELRVRHENKEHSLSAGLRFHPESLRGRSRLKVKMIDGSLSGQSVWVPFSASLSKLNFVDRLDTPEGTLSMDELPERTELPLQALKTPSRWLMNRNQKTSIRSSPLADSDLLGTIPPYSPLALIQSDWQRWARSTSMTHGTIWWLAESTALSSKPLHDLLSSQEVFKRPLFDVSSNIEGLPLTLVSAQGVYLSHDKRNWKRLNRFGEQNQAVAVTSEGYPLVGDTISRDQGQSFEPIIRWDQVLSKLPKKLSANVQPKILKIQPQTSNARHITYHIDMGGGQLVIAETKDGGATWLAHSFKDS